jgi:hypothetical protein
MPDIDRYIKPPTAFDPETLSAMGIAYESALGAFPTSAPTDVREVIATRIIDGARAGERDPAKLCRIALSALCLEARQ